MGVGKRKSDLAEVGLDGSWALNTFEVTKDGKQAFKIDYNTTLASEHNVAVTAEDGVFIKSGGEGVTLASAAKGNLVQVGSGGAIFIKATDDKNLVMQTSGAAITARLDKTNQFLIAHEKTQGGDDFEITSRIGKTRTNLRNVVIDPWEDRTFFRSSRWADRMNFIKFRLRNNLDETAKGPEWTITQETSEGFVTFNKGDPDEENMWGIGEGVNSNDLLFRYHGYHGDGAILRLTNHGVYWKVPEADFALANNSGDPQRLQSAINNRLHPAGTMMFYPSWGSGSNSGKMVYKDNNGNGWYFSMTKAYSDPNGTSNKTIFNDPIGSNLTTCNAPDNITAASASDSAEGVVRASYVQMEDDDDAIGQAVPTKVPVPEQESVAFTTANWWTFPNGGFYINNKFIGPTGYPMYNENNDPDVAVANTADMLAKKAMLEVYGAPTAELNLFIGIHTWLHTHESLTGSGYT